jgi:hypothetical protein
MCTIHLDIFISLLAVMINIQMTLCNLEDKRFWPSSEADQSSTENYPLQLVGRTD